MKLLRSATCIPNRYLIRTNVSATGWCVGSTCIAWNLHLKIIDVRHICIWTCVGMLSVSISYLYWKNRKKDPRTILIATTAGINLVIFAEQKKKIVIFLWSSFRKKKKIGMDYSSSRRETSTWTKIEKKKFRKDDDKDTKGTCLGLFSFLANSFLFQSHNFYFYF